MASFSSFNWIDYIVLAVFFFSIMGGLTSGFAKEVVSLLSWIAAFVVACLFSQSLANFFTSSPHLQNAVSSASSSIGVSAAQPVSYLALGISFAALFMGTALIGSMIGRFLHYAVEGTGMSFVNRLLGGLFGAGRGFILVLIGIFLIQLSPVINQPAWQASQFVNAFQPSVQSLSNFVSPSLANIKLKIGETVDSVSSGLKGTTDTYNGFQSR